MQALLGDRAAACKLAVQDMLQVGLTGQQKQIGWGIGPAFILPFR